MDKQTVAQIKFVRDILDAASGLTSGVANSWVSVYPVQWDIVAADVLEHLDGFEQLVKQAKHELGQADE